MTINQKYHQLLEAYSPENLNNISQKLILLYKNRNYAKIREIANKISKYVLIDEEKDARCFSKLIMLYHPDKGNLIRNELTRLFNKNNYEALEKYGHIFKLSFIENMVIETIDPVIEYNPEYVWEEGENQDFCYTNEYGVYSNNEEPENYDFEKSFFNLIKIREYGRLNIEVPGYYFEDFEEFEMEGSGLETLDGVEYCTHIKILDVSNNHLTDISNLWKLEFLEELYLANNHIGYIDALSNLTNLKYIDLSGNEIDDISPLFDLHKLEYVNLVGNRISEQQVKTLENKGCVVCKSSN